MKLGTMFSKSTRVLWLLICVRCASSIVPAPAGVSVVCKDYQAVVSWAYSQQRLVDTLFRVSINSMPISDTPDLQYNLSKMVWESLFSSTDIYIVTVSAVSGDQESKRSIAPKFTFNELHGNQVQVLCSLDLPPVTLLVSGKVAKMNFQNPMRTRQELRWSAKESDPLVLNFDVTADNMTYQGKCSAKELTCTLEFGLRLEKKQHCVSLKAMLTNGIQVMKFNQQDNLCGNDGTGHYWVFMTLLLIFFILVVCIVVFMVWRVKACVRQSPPLPPPLTWGEPCTNRQIQHSETVCFSAVEQGPQEPPDPNMFRGSDTASSSHTPDWLSEVDDQETLRMELSSESPRSSGSVSGICPQSDVSGEDPEEGPPPSSGEEEPHSGYDRTHNPCVDMGDGDMAQGYGQ